MPGQSREDLIRQDVEDLRKLGYAQQLFREMGGFSNFAISFSIISILTGAVLLYGYGLKFAGPIINTVGWPIVSLFTLCVAASMAELASAYPTAGGLYFWAFRLGGRAWAWVTAWLNMIGQVTITAGINIAAAIYIIGAVTRIFDIPADTQVPVFGSLTNWYFQLFVMVLITIPQVLINIFGIRLTARLNDFSVWWHIGGVILIAALLTVFGSHHNPLSFLFNASPVVNPLEASSAELAPGKTAPAIVFGDFKLPSPLFACFRALRTLYRAAPFALVFVLALLQAQWTYTGYDASAHVAEETVMARLELRLGRVPVRRRLGRRRLCAAAGSHLVHPARRRCQNGQGRLPGPLHRLRKSRQILCQRRRNHHRRRHVAVRRVVYHVDVPHVVRVRARRRHAGLKTHQPRQSALSDAGRIDSHYERSHDCDLRVCRRVLGRHLHQHGHALSGLRDSSLSQLAQPPPQRR